MSEITLYISLLEKLKVEGFLESKLLPRARAVERLLAGEALDVIAADTKLQRGHVVRWADVVERQGLYAFLGKEEPSEKRLDRARAGIAQIMMAGVAEEYFSSLATEVLGGEGFKIEDQRVGRTDTDYRLLDAHSRPVCRLNVKFHGTLFRGAKQWVDLDPEDCFALATYKIHGALKRQDTERVPYVFLVISVPDFPRATIEKSIPADWVTLASVSDRATEEAIVALLRREPWADDIAAAVRRSEFRVISARRAYLLLREKLFDRVHALRVRDFNRTFRRAEIDMHLSLSDEMIPFRMFLETLAKTGVQGIAVRLESGEI